MNANVKRRSKRINETNETTTWDKTYTNVHLKAPTSREFPVLIVKDSAFPKYNYMKYNDWYYFIDDIVSLDNNRYELHCSADALSNGKDSIGGTKGFCNFGPPSLSNIHIPDPRFTPDVLAYTFDTGNNEATDEFDIRDTTNGVVVIKIVSFDTTNGGVKTLCGDMTAFLTLLSSYATAWSSNWSTLTDKFEILAGMYCGLGNALNNIKSAVWLPIKQSSISTNNIYNKDIGGYPIAGTWYEAKAQYLQGPIESEVNLHLDLPNHVQYYPWLKGSNYLTIQLNTPGGLLDLSSNNHIYDTGTKIDFKFRLLASINGECALYVYSPITTTTESKAVNLNYEISGIQQWNWSIDLMGLLYTAPTPQLLGAKAGAKIGIGVTAALSGMGGGITSIGQAVSNQAANHNSIKGLEAGYAMQDIGAGISDVYNKNLASGIAGIAKSIPNNEGGYNAAGPNNITCLFANDTKRTIHLLALLWVPKIFLKAKEGGGWEVDKTNYETFCTNYGYPVFDYAQIASYKGYSGYYEMAGTSVSVNLPPASTATINSFVNSGFYYN